MAIHVRRLSPKHDQIFTFVVEDTGECIHIAINRLVDYVEGTVAEPVLVELTPNVVQRYRDRVQGVEEDHAATLPEEALEHPIFLLHCDDDSYVFADDNHRVWRRIQRGDTNVMGYVVEPKTWNRFRVEGLPNADDSARWHDYIMTGKRGQAHAEIIKS